MKSLSFNIFNRKNDQNSAESDLQKIFFTKEFSDHILIEDTDFEVIEVNIESNCFVFADDTLIRLKSLATCINKIKLPYNGQIINNHIKVGQSIKIGTLLFEVKKANNISNFSELAFEYNAKKLRDTLVTMCIDDFTKEKSIFFSKVAGQETKYFDTYSSDSIHSLGITFENNNGFTYMKFQTTSPTFNLSKGDSMILLFDDESTMNIKFLSKPNIDKISGYKISYYTNIKPLTIQEIDIFAKNNLKKIKITSEKRGLYDVYHLQKILPDSQYKSEIEAQYLLKFMVAMFVKQHIDNNIKLPSS
jgi:hypothetical protein